MTFTRQLLKLSLFISTSLQISYAETMVSNSGFELKLVHLIWRHGDRNPEVSYPTDPYKDVSYWPDGYGELTEIGIEQHHSLGRYFRNRYIHSGFLQKHFDPKEVFVESSSINRTIQSAIANLRGFFGGAELRATRWDENNNVTVKTQPSIPVNLIPREMDNKLFQMNASCPQLNKVFREFMDNSPVIKDIMKKEGWIFDYLSNHSGEAVTNLIQLTRLYNILYIQNLRNFTLPDWTRKIFIESATMSNLAQFTFKIATDTDKMKRFRGGPLLKEIVRHIDHHVVGRPGTKYRKLYAYSAHDLTITSILDTLGVFDIHQPDYASAIMIELKRNITSGNYFVDILYRNDTSRDPYILHPPGCSKPSCELKTFMQNSHRFLPKNWRKECQLLGI